MFIHQSHLPQILDASSYHCAEQHARELSQLFLPGWHMVGAVDDLAADGDFFTTQLFDRPLLLWRMDGEIRAFLNVCAHRFSMLTNERCGHAERLRCQYHGWEYDEQGRTRKIPDAPSFRPLAQGEFGLKKVHVATCGQLVYVSLSDDPPPLSDYLGRGFEFGAELFAEARHRTLSLDLEVEANWKLVIENALESYHVETVHAKTFQKIPAAEACDHAFDDGWSSFITVEPPKAGRLERWFDRRMHKRLGWELTDEYKHFIFYPNNLFGTSRSFSWAMVVLPLAPNRCRLLLRAYCRPVRKRNPLAQLMFRIVVHGAARFGKAVILEDVAILPSVQRGLESAIHPSRGLISIREERVYHFQQYIQRATNHSSDGEDERAQEPTSTPLQLGQQSHR